MPTIRAYVYLGRIVFGPGVVALAFIGTASRLWSAETPSAISLCDVPHAINYAVAKRVDATPAGAFTVRGANCSPMVRQA